MSTDGVDDIVKLNSALMGIENDMMRRAIERRDNAIDNIVGQVNQLADDGVIEICGSCDDGDDVADEPESPTAEE